MKIKLVVFVFVCISSYFAVASDGLVSKQSDFTVQETADRFEAVIVEKGLTLFARISHSDNAKNVGHELRPTETIIFGNPKVGTPLMQCAQNIAIDLPQKALIWQDEAGKVWFSYNDPKYLKQRHQVAGCDQVFDKVSNVLSTLSGIATQD